MKDTSIITILRDALMGKTVSISGDKARKVTDIRADYDSEGEYILICRTGTYEKCDQVGPEADILIED